MDCSDRRLVLLCTQAFQLLKSDQSKGSVGHKEVVVRQNNTTGSRSLTLMVGIDQIDMIYKPYNGYSGSSEGANVFIQLPFKDNEGNAIRISCYYSERGKEPVLMASNSSITSSPTYSGVRRVCTAGKVDMTRPY